MPPPEGWPSPLERCIGDGGSRRYFCPVHGYFQAYPRGSPYKKRSRSEQLCSDDIDEGSSGEGEKVAAEGRVTEECVTVGLGGSEQVSELARVELAATPSQVTQQLCV